MRAPCGKRRFCAKVVDGVTSILFVCLGNICRSPAAEAVFRALSDGTGAGIAVDSAGILDLHVGNPPYGPMITHAAARGVDLSHLRARQFCAADFDAFDLIITMDAQNLADAERLRPPGLGYAPETGIQNVPDPYYTGDFEAALDLIEQASHGLLKSLT